jgi:hypothetical protein
VWSCISAAGAVDIGDDYWNLVLISRRASQASPSSNNWTLADGSTVTADVVFQVQIIIADAAALKCYLLLPSHSHLIIRPYPYPLPPTLLLQTTGSKVEPSIVPSCVDSAGLIKVHYRQYQEPQTQNLFIFPSHHPQRTPSFAASSLLNPFSFLFLGSPYLSSPRSTPANLRLWRRVQHSRIQNRVRVASYITAPNRPSERLLLTAFAIHAEFQCSS